AAPERLTNPAVAANAIPVTATLAEPATETFPAIALIEFPVTAVFAAPETETVPAVAATEIPEDETFAPPVRETVPFDAAMEFPVAALVAPPERETVPALAAMEEPGAETLAPPDSVTDPAVAVMAMPVTATVTPMESDGSLTAGWKNLDGETTASAVGFETSAMDLVQRLHRCIFRLNRSARHDKGHRECQTTECVAHGSGSVHRNGSRRSKYNAPATTRRCKRSLRFKRALTPASRT